MKIYQQPSKLDRKLCLIIHRRHKKYLKYVKDILITQHHVKLETDGLKL